MAGDDLAAQRAQLRGQGIGEVLGPAADDRPAVGMSGDREDQPEGGRQRPIEPEHRVGAQPGQRVPVPHRRGTAAGQAHAERIAGSPNRAAASG